MVIDSDSDSYGSVMQPSTAMEMLGSLNSTENLEAKLELMSKVLASLLQHVASLGNGSCNIQLDDIEKRIAKVEQHISTSGNLQVGDFVRIDGLDNVAHLHLNGKKAQVRRWEGPGGRWVVQVCQNNEMKSLKLGNLHLLPQKADIQEPKAEDQADWQSRWEPIDGGGGLSVGDIVEICKLRRMGQLNGSRGELISWDDENGRWVVKLKSGSQKRLRIGNLRRIGEAVRVPASIRKELVEKQTSAARLESGMLVELTGLSASYLNGMRGILQRWDAQSSRWIVHMKESADEKSLRPDNLEVVSGSVRAGNVASIAGLEQAAYLNGKAVEVLKWHGDKGRWAVQVIDENVDKFLRPENLAVMDVGSLSVGSNAVIHGLEQAEELNGCVAKLVHWNSADSRWLIRVTSNGEEKRLRPRRLAALSANKVAEHDSQQVDSQAQDEAMDEIIGSSESEEDEFTKSEAETRPGILQEGLQVSISGGGAHSGKLARLVRWEDVGGPFGEWVVKIHGSNLEIQLPVAALVPHYT